MRCLIVQLSLFVSLLLSPIMALAQQVWFAPPDNLQRGNKTPINQDFPHLFDQPPAWSVQADVFLISVSGHRRWTGSYASHHQRTHS